MEIPLYAFTGFLDSGKSTFIQKTLSDPTFHKGEKTLLLALEEGEEEFDVSQYSGGGVVVEYLEEVSAEILQELQDKYSPERVVVEFNGMEKIEEIYEIMPAQWDIAQEICFVDSTTILNYNANMRELVVEKIMGAELVVFNRVPVGADIMPFHSLVRAITRQADIAYEYVNGDTQFDEIEDPLPFDRDADFMEIGDKDFALWYRDLNEEQEVYDGKSVKFKAQVAKMGEDLQDCFAPGRFVMTCCADDIEFMAVPAICASALELEERTWITISGKVSVERHPVYYGEVGPILRDVKWELTEPADPDYAQF